MWSWAERGGCGCGRKERGWRGGGLMLGMLRSLWKEEMGRLDIGSIGEEQKDRETHHATAHSPKYTPRNSNRPTPTHHDSQPARGYSYPAAAMSNEGSAGKSRALSRGIDVVFLLGLRLAKTREEKTRERTWGMGKL